MKPSELLMLLLCSDNYYDPTNCGGTKSFMCCAAKYWAYGKGDEAESYANALTDAINNRLGKYGSLETYLFNDHSIARNNYDARYEWFFDLALELENMGQ